VEIVVAAIDLESKKLKRSTTKMANSKKVVERWSKETWGAEEEKSDDCGVT